VRGKDNGEDKVKEVDSVGDLGQWFNEERNRRNPHLYSGAIGT
jgi:hypothetical protein